MEDGSKYDANAYSLDRARREIDGLRLRVESLEERLSSVIGAPAEPAKPAGHEWFWAVLKDCRTVQVRKLTLFGIDFWIENDLERMKKLGGFLWMHQSGDFLWTPDDHDFKVLSYNIAQSKISE